MKSLPLLMLVALVPAAQEPSSDALKREVLYNSLHRQMLPMLPFGAIVDIAEMKKEKGEELVCFLSWHYDLDEPSCAALRQKLLTELKTAGVDLAKPDLKAYAAVASKVMWHEIYETEAASKLATLQKKLDVRTPAMRIGASISFRLGAESRCLTTMGSTKEWAFVMP